MLKYLPYVIFAIGNWCTLWGVAKWLERPTANANVAAVLESCVQY